MGTNNNKPTIGDVVASLLVSDCLNYFRLAVANTDTLVSSFKYQYGALYNYEGHTHFTDSISRPLGSTSIITPHGEITNDFYRIIDSQPDFYSEILEYADDHTDLITLCQIVGYPIKQLFSEDYIEVSEGYKQTLRNVFDQIQPYLDVIPTVDLDITSDIEMEEKRQSRVSDVTKEIEAFVNEE